MEEELGVAAYPVTPGVRDWLIHNLLAIEGDVFALWRRLMPVMSKVIENDQAEAVGEEPPVPEWVLMAHLRELNDALGTNYTLVELRSRSICTYNMADARDWGMYTREEDQEPVIFGPTSEVGSNVLLAGEEVEWGVLWEPRNEVILVYRSPHLGCRLPIEDEDIPGEYQRVEQDRILSAGLLRSDERHGGVQCYVLPPEIEGVILQDRGE